MSWFTDMSKAQQAAYIKAHPNSKYAKGSKSAKTSTSSKAPASKKGRPRKTEHEKQITYMNRMLRRENRYYAARQVPYDPTR